MNDDEIEVVIAHRLNKVIKESIEEFEFVDTSRGVRFSKLRIIPPEGKNDSFKVKIISLANVW
jgi:hypothetical protein